MIVKEFSKTLEYLKLTADRVLDKEYPRSKAHDFAREIRVVVDILEEKGWKISKIEKLLQNLADHLPIDCRHIDY